MEYKYLYFLPDSHYGYPEAHWSETFPGITDRDLLMGMYSNAAYGAMSDMEGDDDDVLDAGGQEGLYTEHGNQEICQTVYYFKSDESTREELAYSAQDIACDHMGGGGEVVVSEFESILLQKCGNLVLVIREEGANLIGDPDKDKMYNLLDGIDLETVKELAILSADYGLNIIEYLRNKRGFTDVDIDDLSLMRRMKKRRRYT